jgi:excisionase family DNA binding protein
MTEKYLGGKEACRQLGVHPRTLYNWEEKGKIDTIRTPGNKRLYNVEKYIKEQNSIFKNLYNNEINERNEINEINEMSNKKEKLKIIYTRVSSISQKDDLERQKNYMLKRYPNYLLIEDIGSGLNFNRRGLRKIIKYAINGEIDQVIVAYKDRLARFGFELIEDLIKEYSNGKIIILNQKKDIEPEEELVKDMLQIMNIFTAKMNGLRKYKEKSDISI